MKNLTFKKINEGFMKTYKPHTLLLAGFINLFAATSFAQNQGSEYVLSGPD